jgi:predicted  nucleic acid-binding Zn-ribbon protein
VTATQENLNTLKAAHTSASSDAAAVVQADRDALISAKANLEAITAEREVLKTAHTVALQDLTTKLNEHRNKAADVETLEKELSDLKTEKDETATKLSELEIEILELKESQDKAEDEHGQALSRIKYLEAELAKAVAATQQAIDDAAAKDVGHLQRAADVQNTHDERLKAITEGHAKVMVHLEALKTELAASQVAQERVKTDAQEATEDHHRQLSEAEKLHLAKQGELMEQIRKISTELEVREMSIPRT